MKKTKIHSTEVSSYKELMQRIKNVNFIKTQQHFRELCNVINSISSLISNLYPSIKTIHRNIELKVLGNHFLL